MKTKLSDHFDQLSPLIDDIIARIESIGLPALEIARLSAEVQLRIAIGAELLVAQAADGGCALTTKECEERLAIILDNKRKSDAALMAVIERYGAQFQ